MKNFDELKLSEPLTKALLEMGFTAPTPIQAETLPILLGNKGDFVGMAATGTGKTAAFGIPLLERIDPEKREIQAVVLCPTRELAVQVCEQITMMGKHKQVHAQAIYGGTGFSDQLRGLKRGAFVIVATPGRLIDHIRQGNISLNTVRTLVLDEADEMISMGFKEDLEFIMDQCSKESCCRWMFAATMSPSLRTVADRYLRNPQNAKVNEGERLSGTVKQIYFTIREKNKAKGLCKLIDMAEDFYGLIFCQTKVQVIALTEYLKARGYRVDCLHGDKGQYDRERTLALIKSKAVNIVVCSDVAARGLDVKELTHVINFSLPLDFDSYIHRIGRTGRNGMMGIAMSLVTPAQMHMINRLQNVTRSKMEVGIFPTRKEISIKKLKGLLANFSEALGYEKAMEILNDEWKAKLEGMSKEEITGRFLALSHPDLFDDREQAEEIVLGSPGNDEERPRRRFSPGGPRSGGRTPWRGGGGSGERRPFRPRRDEGQSARPFTPRDDQAPRPFRPRRDEGQSSRPFTPRDDQAPRQAPGPFRPRREGAASGRPFTPRDGQAPRPFRPNRERSPRPENPVETKFTSYRARDNKPFVPKKRFSKTGPKAATSASPKPTPNPS